MKKKIEKKRITCRFSNRLNIFMTSVALTRNMISFITFFYLAYATNLLAGALKLLNTVKIIEVGVNAKCIFISIDIMTIMKVAVFNCT